MMNGNKVCEDLYEESGTDVRVGGSPVTCERGGGTEVFSVGGNFSCEE